MYFCETNMELEFVELPAHGELLTREASEIAGRPSLQTLQVKLASEW
jgi:hypothetical protein